MAPPEPRHDNCRAWCDLARELGKCENVCRLLRLKDRMEPPPDTDWVSMVDVRDFGRQPRSQRYEVAVAWLILVASVLGGIVDVVLWLTGNISTRAMVGITLALSWAAITLTALDYLKTARVHRDQR